MLLGQRVEILADAGPVRGVVAARLDPSRADEKKAVEIKDLHVDAGFRSRDEALERLRVGDLGVIAVEPLELANGRIASRSLDNRIGAYVVLETVRRLAEAGGAPGPVVAVASVEEEIGDLMGARTSAYALEPGAALAVDVTSASDVPGAEAAEIGEHKVGAGPAVLRGMTVHPKVFRLLMECAEAEGIAASVEVPHPRTGTDASGVYVSRAGVPSGVVSVPTRYIHTPIETAELADIESCVRLVVAFAQRVGELARG
jgi:endoglucanase